MNINLVICAFAKAAEDIYIHYLIIAILLDIATGILKGIKQKRLNSTIGVNGLVKHTAIILLVCLTYPYLALAEMGYLINAMLFFYISVYGISVLENLEAIGVPFPSFIRKIFKQMREYTENGSESRKR